MSVARNVLLALAVTAVTCVMTAGASAGNFTVAPLVAASGPSPFAGCTVGAAPGSVLYPNAEEEPWVDVNPTNPLNLIAVWQQDRWSDGGAHGLVTAVSHNGGARGRRRSRTSAPARAEPQRTAATTTVLPIRGCRLGQTGRPIRSVSRSMRRTTPTRFSPVGRPTAATRGASRGRSFATRATATWRSRSTTRSPSRPTP